MIIRSKKGSKNMLHIVEIPLCKNERNLLSCILVSFGKIQNIQPENIMYFLHKDTTSLKMYIEYDEELIEFEYVYENYEYKLFVKNLGKINFFRFTQEIIQEILQKIIFSIECKKFIFLAWNEEKNIWIFY